MRNKAGALAVAGFPSVAARLAPDAVANDSIPRQLPRDTLAAWMLALAEAAGVVSAGIASGSVYSLLADHDAGDVRVFAAVGLLTAALFAGARRLVEAGRGIDLDGDVVALRRAVVAWCAVFGLLAVVAFLMKSGSEMSRGAMLSFFVTGLFAAETARAAAGRALVRWYLPSSLRGEHLLLVGAEDEPELDRLQDEFLRAGANNLSVLPLAAHGPDAGWAGERYRYLQRVMECARVSGHGRICVAGAGIPAPRLRELLNDLQTVPRAIELVPAAAVERLLHLPQRSFGRLRAIEIQRAPLNSLQRTMKRAIDLVVAAAALIVAALPMAAIALAIRLDSPGPILFRQKRLGFRGRGFSILKFRTMTVQENGATVRQATRNDARVTRVGRFLRAWSLDELPQLFNVLGGEMSLVGPRPHACAHDERYARLIEHYELRQHVKPGITGWAQVHGRRGETPTVESMRDRVDFDIWYAKHVGIALDIEILFRTAFEVFRRRNAY